MVAFNLTQLTADSCKDKIATMVTVLNEVIAFRLNLHTNRPEFRNQKQNQNLSQ